MWARAGRVRCDRIPSHGRWHFTTVTATPTPTPTPTSTSTSTSTSIRTDTTVPIQIFSGIQPTGSLHLGNYLGAIVNWVNIAKRPHDHTAITTTTTTPTPTPPPGSRTVTGTGAGPVPLPAPRPVIDPSTSRPPLFCIVDLHALTTTVPGNGTIPLHQQTFSMACALLACGLPPSSCSLFVQSHVRQHAELCWILACRTAQHVLNSMTQYKDKKGKAKEGVGLGLYAYPVLQAADILLYRGTHVPVGDDQAQHLELSRDLALAFNRFYDVPLFPTPHMLTTHATRVMSLRDARSKMSKSDLHDGSRINLTDTDDQIHDKIIRAKTDSDIGVTLHDPETRPEISNLIDIYHAITGIPISTIVSTLEFQVKEGKLHFKQALIQALVSVISPIRSEMVRLSADPAYVMSILHAGAQRAEQQAEDTMRQIRHAIQLLPKQ